MGKETTNKNYNSKPNKDTLIALNEKEAMKKDRKKYKRYDSFAQLLADVD